MSDHLAVLDQRPQPGEPRAYDFPDFERTHLDNGLTIVRCHVPGRPLLPGVLIHEVTQWLVAGMLNVKRGIREGPTIALFADSAAATPSGFPVPKLSGFFENFRI